MEKTLKLWHRWKPILTSCLENLKNLAKKTIAKKGMVKTAFLIMKKNCPNCEFLIFGTRASQMRGVYSLTTDADSSEVDEEFGALITLREKTAFGRL